MNAIPQRLRTDALLWNLGFVAAAGQSFLFRELGLLFEGNEIVGAVMLSAWLLLTGGGALGCGLARGRAFTLAREWVSALLGVSLLFSILAVRLARPFLSDLPGASPSLGAVTFSTFLLLAPFCIPAGFLFPAFLRRPGKEDRPGSRGYVLESAGFLVGGMLSSLALIPLLSNLQSVLVVLVLGAGGSLAFLSLRPPRIASGVLGALALAVLVSPLADRLDRTTREARFPGERLLESTDTLLGTFSVTERAGLVTFRDMGAPSGDNAPSRSCAEYVHLVILAHRAPRRVALLGGGMAGELAEVSRHRVSVAMTLPDRGAFRAALPFLAEADARALRGEDVRLEFVDGRVFLERVSGSGDAFDVLLVPVGDPLTGFQNRYYTVEFFRAARSALRPGGILGLRLSSSPGYSSLARRRLVSSIRLSLESVFDRVRTVSTHNAGTLLLASEERIRLETEFLAAHLERAGFTTDVVNPRWIDHVARSALEAGEAPGREGGAVPLNTDMKPASYMLAFSLWESRFGASSLATLAAVTIPPLALLAVAGLWAWRRGGKRWRDFGPAWTACAAGFAGMAFEVGLLLAFQSAAGFLYGFLGALVAAFMAGACAGAIVGSIFPTSRRAGLAFGTAFLALGFTGWIVLPEVGSGLGLPVAVFLFSALQFLAGFLTGVFFPLALRSHSAGEREGSGLLWAADLGGAALGAILAGAVVVPLLGIPLLLLLAGAVAFTGALAVR